MKEKEEEKARRHYSIDDVGRYAPPNIPRLWDEYLIFLIKDSWKPQYVECLSNIDISRASKSTFLTMKDYDPWDIKHPSHKRDRPGES
ncbi:hypothetical protein N7537_009098 [Penicillium hordei]|uniref:Uncharacterized protein n=1 Tax=Penicillium hordei TaxID=40994 RepID=A0AAD6DTL6_9EURO|nr:uncharacterized protein N7537_009098 [Penicillium hordei]KAJ5592194.1 hypothetical protein N7537_009098 [Penicillium hordei]